MTLDAELGASGSPSRRPNVGSRTPNKRGAPKRLTPTNVSLRKAPGVLYHNVASLLRGKIEAGKWIAGERLPSIEALAIDLGVSVTTVRLALKLLEGDHLIERQQGRGTFVSRSLKDKKWVKLVSNWDQLIRMWGNHKPEPIAAYDTIAVPHLTPEDGVAAPSYRCMQRVHALEDTPYAVVEIYIDRRLYVLHPKRFDTEMAVVVLNSLDEVSIEGMTQTVTICTADIETASRLGISVGAPVGVVRRVVRDTSKTVIQVGVAIYRGDLVKLEQEILRPAR